MSVKPRDREKSTERKKIYFVKGVTGPIKTKMKRKNINPEMRIKRQC